MGLVVWLGIITHRARQLDLIGIDWSGSSGGGNWGTAGGRSLTTSRGGEEEEDDNDDKDDSGKDGVEDANDAVPPCRPRGSGGRIKSFGSPANPHVILPPPGGGCVIVIGGREGEGGGGVASILRPLRPQACLPRQQMTMTQTTTMNTMANMTTTKTKMAVSASSASCGIGETPAASHQHLKREDDTIQWLHSRFGGNQWYSRGRTATAAALTHHGFDVVVVAKRSGTIHECADARAFEHHRCTNICVFVLG